MAIKLYKVSKSGNLDVSFQASTLDELTRDLPPGFYTTFSTLAQGTRVLGMRSHLQRLYHPAKEAGLHPAVDENTLRGRIAEFVKESLPHESRVRVILTKDKGDVYICIQPFIPLPRSAYANGVHVLTSNIARHDPRIKNTVFITESIDQRKLLSKDVFEVLMTRDGRILEGMTSNFYAVKYVMTGNVAKESQTNAIKIITAKRGILLGVTRKVVLRLARGQGISIEYRAPKMNVNFDEAFLTSSSRGVVPIVQIDNRIIGSGKCGRIATNLQKAYSFEMFRVAEQIFDHSLIAVPEGL
ncbi:MAG: aminotransferase class IV [Anaerolineales bacterium]|nr:MAG: aminotransferase class IV [Anaerolineales bacterium]